MLNKMKILFLLFGLANFLLLPEIIVALVGRLQLQVIVAFVMNLILFFS